MKKGAFRSGKVGAIITGFALGPVFSSCTPTYAFILATVLPRNFAAGFAYLMAYIVGLTIVLLLIAVKGRKFLIRFTWAVDSHSRLRRSLGALFIVGIAIGFGIDKKVELWVTEYTPFNVSALDQKLLSNKTSTATRSPTSTKAIVSDSTFNVTPYKAPEFSFEKVLKNVQSDVKQRGLTYPVALDNDFATWNAYANEYWPAHYLIDRAGNVVATHFGEGDYAQTEATIQKLLICNFGLCAPSR